MSNEVFFIGLPYAALAIMLGGTIRAYSTYGGGFKFSSLSSQFLESKELFWGVQPFHIGLGTLFFGHLIAFLFPRYVLAWNGMPIRLFILEATAFAFGLLTFIGLILLVIRRLKNKKIRMVTSVMDVIVYIILLFQLCSGLYIAYTYNWGSSWFASTLTPYLRSLFIFAPDISAVAVMPFLVKFHIISAYIFILLTPFSRFVHFLVFPFTYIIRPYQVVIWNRNMKEMRKSRRMRDGVKSVNN